MKEVMSVSSYYSALMASRAGRVYREPYARMLRIGEYIIHRRITSGTRFDSFNHAYRIMSNAWAQMSEELCVQENFDLD